MLAIPLVSPILGACRASQKQTGEEWNQAKTKRYLATEIDQQLLSDAKKNIELFRKGKLQVQLLHNGQSISATDYSIRLQKHAFEFGTIRINSQAEIETAPQYYPRIQQTFNCYTAKCYWNERWHQPIEQVEGQRIYNVFEEEIRLARQLGLKVKGHPLIWTVPKALPKWLDKYSVEVRLQKLLDHVEDMVGRYKDDVQIWDLCNEFLWEPSLNHTYQRKWPHIENIPEILTYLQPGMEVARKTNPKARFVLNEYGLEKDYRTEISAQTQRKRILELVHEMKKRGCPPDSIGTQCHVAEPFTMQEIQTCLDHLAEACLPLQITEFWARVNPNEEDKSHVTDQMLQYMQDAYTIGFGHPAVEHFTYWGGDLLDKKGMPNQKFEAIEKLVAHTWISNFKEIEAAGQPAHLHAFYGTYALEKAGKTLLTFDFKKSQNGEVLPIELP